MLGAGSFFVSASVCLGLVGCLGKDGPCGGIGSSLAGESSALTRDCDQEIGAQAKDLAWGWTGSSLARQSLSLPSY